MRYAAGAAYLAQSSDAVGRLVVALLWFLT